MNNILDSNLQAVIDKAMKAGGNIDIVTVECPCCHKFYYALKNDIYYKLANRSEEDYTIDTKKFSLSQLTEKCPNCGFAGELTPGEFLNLGRAGLIHDEIKADKQVIDNIEKQQTPWSTICGLSPAFDNKERSND